MRVELISHISPYYPQTLKKKKNVACTETGFIDEILWLKLFSSHLIKVEII